MADGERTTRRTDPRSARDSERVVDICEISAGLGFLLLLLLSASREISFSVSGGAECVHVTHTLAFHSAGCLRPKRATKLRELNSFVGHSDYPNSNFALTILLSPPSSDDRQLHSQQRCVC